MDHSVCPHHEAVQVTLDRLALHCNGSHVRMEQVTRCQEDVTAVTQQVRELVQSVSDLRRAIDVDKASGSRTLTLLVAAITTAGVIAQAVIAHLAR
jgi:hypothetical protein